MPKQDKMIVFPKTPYLWSNSIREDKVLTEEERDDFLNGRVIIEEKLDGYNLGISFDENYEVQFQHRGSYIEDEAVKSWFHKREDIVADKLHDRYIMFGEWMKYKHSIYYDRLPDWFIGFDIYDIIGNRFLRMKEKNIMFDTMEIRYSPVIEVCYNTNLEDLFSYYEDGSWYGKYIEGIYLRREKGEEIHRAKLVQETFTQNIIEHWSAKKELNKLYFYS